MNVPDIRNKSFGEVVLNGLRTLPQTKIFQINGETGESQTVGETLEQSVQVASGLRKLGVGVEDIVAILSHYSDNCIAVIFGTLLQGAAPFPMEHNLKQREMEHMFKISRPRVIFLNLNMLNNAKKALASIQHEAPIFVLDGEGEGGQGFDQVLDLDVDVEKFESSKIDRPDQRVAAVLPSSGTTGLPKGVAATHAAYLCQFELLHEITPKSLYLQLTPPFWISGFMMLAYSPIFGYSRLYVAHNTADNIVQAIHKYKPGWGGLAPITMAHILNYPDLNKYDLSSLTTVIIGGTAVPKSTIDLTREKLPHITKMSQAYGATEIGGVATIPFDTTNIYSAGKPFELHQCKIVNERTRERVEINEDGEIVVKTPAAFKCYIGDEQATRDAFDNDGYYLTGDIGHFDDKGYLFITGRSKELFKVRNHQVSPAEVEDVIRGLAGVADVAVVGIPHEIDQNHPRALVVKQPGSSITLQQIVDEVAEKLSETKQLLAGAQFVDDVPRNTNGKLLRSQLLKLVTN